MSERRVLNSTDWLIIIPMSGNLSAFYSLPSLISEGILCTPLTTSTIFLRVVSIFSLSSSSLGSKVICSSLIPMLKSPIFLLSFFISSRSMLMELCEMLTSVSIMMKSTSLMKLGNLSLSLLAICSR